MGVPRGNRDVGQDQHHDADRHVDPEHRAPADVLGDPAEQRAYGEEDHRDPGVEPHRASTLLGLERVDDDGPGGGDHHRRADALAGAGGEQDRLASGQPAHHRAGDEHRRADLEDPVVPEHVADPPAHRDECGDRKQVGVDDPLQSGLRDVELALDGRERN
jgi:hypothetical protein